MRHNLVSSAQVRREQFWSDDGIWAIYAAIGLAPVLISLLAAIGTCLFNRFADVDVLRFSMISGALPFVVPLVVDKDYSWRLALLYVVELALVIWQSEHIALALISASNWLHRIL